MVDRAVLSPSDLTAADVDADLAGRVVATLDAGRVLLGDAFAQLELELPSGAACEMGDLLVVRASRRERVWLGLSLLEQHRPVAPVPTRELDRLVGSGVGEGLRARATLLRELRSYFAEQRFLEVETPAIVPSPGLDLHLDAFEVPGGGHLITSPEYQMKRLLAGGVPRCFQVCRCFRKGEVGARHNPEFTMLEWYRSFAAVDSVMSDTEAIVRLAASALGDGRQLRVGERRISLEGPFERLSVGEAFARWASVSSDEAIDLASRDEARFFRLLVDRIEPALAEIERPVFLVDYPAPCASLARLSPRDPRVAERFELYVAGVELCNGFGELTDPREQRARFVADQAARSVAGKPVYPIDERFLEALEQGMPPASGNALGFDRLVAVSLGTDDIRRVTAFPVGWL